MHAALLGALAEARALGFLGPGPLEAHEESAAAFSDALGEISGSALDLGSGGGVPGLLLAAHYARVPWVLLDANRRRTSFLSRAVVTLGWQGRVEVRRAQAELAAHDPTMRARFSVVVARSFGPPALTAECATGFLATGGRLAVAEPPSSSAERWPAAALAKLGLSPVATGRVAIFQQNPQAAAAFPRPLRMMQRSPLW